MGAVGWVGGEDDEREFCNTGVCGEVYGEKRKEVKEGKKEAEEQNARESKCHWESGPARAGISLFDGPAHTTGLPQSNSILLPLSRYPPAYLPAYHPI